MHETSLVSVKVEPRSTSRLLFILPLFNLCLINQGVAKNASVEIYLKTDTVGTRPDGPSYTVEAT